jgi:hypothetical protein
MKKCPDEIQDEGSAEHSSKYKDVRKAAREWLGMIVALGHVVISYIVGPMWISPEAAALDFWKHLVNDCVTGEGFFERGIQP